MSKYFNAEGSCNSAEHYMVDLNTRLIAIKNLIDKGKYFTINRARQYGKTTTLIALEQYLSKDYLVISLDFQVQMSNAKFQEEAVFSAAFAKAFICSLKNSGSNAVGIDKAIQKLEQTVEEEKGNFSLVELFQCLSSICAASSNPVVLMIDETDSAADYQVFIDFLVKLRGYYLHRKKTPTFQSVILAGVYDIRNLKQRIHPGLVSEKNSPWNIAADFNIDMSFSAKDIAGMFTEYEEDYHTGMNIKQMAELFYEYTSGYPFLVSRLAKLMDETIAERQEYPDKMAVWTKKGFLEAVRLLLSEKNTLFESLVNKLYDFEDMRKIIYELLFTGKNIVYNPDIVSIGIALMFGFVKIQNEYVIIANRIFEVRLYNFFLSEELIGSAIYKSALKDRNQFIVNGHLNMELVLKKFIYAFTDLYGDVTEEFVEEAGRRYFLLFLKPVINGSGNYYIEARTREMRRTDVIVDYHGEQFIVEMKIWHGSEYNQRGEQQLCDYLEYYHLRKGYLLSFNFNKNKEVGIKHIEIDGKEIVEAVV